ncbi:hypothetical protein ACFWP7_03835 [Streptomyces sp. NPDC058470]|uniref:hypothetical protein n=1 Tax=Streptomyces sp. NPDC058470 TaxID=3346515 RepID=UPI0036617A50
MRSGLPDVLGTPRGLLWWSIEEVRGLFGDEPDHPRAPLWPSERRPRAIAALNVPIVPAIVPCAFRRHLHDAPGNYLSGPATDLYPHLLVYGALSRTAAVVEPLCLPEDAAGFVSRL